jgi:hypothetical protein
VSEAEGFADVVLSEVRGVAELIDGTYVEQTSTTHGALFSGRRWHGDGDEFLDGVVVTEGVGEDGDGVIDAERIDFGVLSVDEQVRVREDEMLVADDTERVGVTETSTLEDDVKLSGCSCCDIVVYDVVIFSDVKMCSKLCSFFFTSSEMFSTTICGIVAAAAAAKEKPLDSIFLCNLPIGWFVGRVVLFFDNELDLNWLSVGEGEH